MIGVRASEVYDACAREGLVPIEENVRFRLFMTLLTGSIDLQEMQRRGLTRRRIERVLLSNRELCLRDVGEFSHVLGITSEIAITPRRTAITA